MAISWQGNTWFTIDSFHTPFYKFLNTPFNMISYKRNWRFAIVVDLRYFKLWILLDHVVYVWRQDAKMKKLENVSLWKRFNFF